MASDISLIFSGKLLARCRDASRSNSENIGCKYAVTYLLSEDGQALSYAELQKFYECIKTGLENPDSGVGCYAMTPQDYITFAGFFDLVIRDYHGDKSGVKRHVTDWTTSGASHDLKTFGQRDVSMRVRVGRNLVGFNLPGAMDKNERIRFERKMLPVLSRLTAKYGGAVHSLTPDFGKHGPNPNLISEATYRRLVEAHIMFKDMSADRCLRSAGISNDWPYGRGCWHSRDKTRIIWFGEEDLLRIMCMKKGSDLQEPFINLQEILSELEAFDGIEFAKNDKYGYVTSCPSNLGTGMRASVHIKLPNLTSDGTEQRAKKVCKPLSLSVRGVGGEHTPIGADGTVDISPSARLFVTESDIIRNLYEGTKQLLAMEHSIPAVVR